MKRTLLIIAIALNGFNAFAQCNPDITTGLIANWNLTGNAIDSSGNGHNGTVNGATLATDRCGNLNAAYYFNGEGTNQYITVPNSASLSLNNTAFTISAWIKSDSSLANGTILSKRNGSQLTNGYIFFIDGTNQHLGFAVAGGSPGSFGVRSSAAIDTNSWKLVVATYDNITDTMKMYINGVLDTAVGNVPSPTATSSTFRIGNDSYGQAYEFKGKIDDIKLFNRALDSCDVDSLYHTLCSLTGIHENIIATNIQLFPNPNNGRFVVALSNYSLENSKLTITNLIGEKLQENELKFGVNEINIKHSSGIYFLTVSNKNGRYTTKIIVQ